MLSKENRLKNPSSFKRAHKHGIHIPGRFGKIIIYNRSDDDPSQFAVVVSADKGNATKRNKAKRRIRNIFRQLKDRHKGLDVFFVVWKADFEFSEISNQIEKGIEHAIHNHGSN